MKKRISVRNGVLCLLCATLFFNAGCGDAESSKEMATSEYAVDSYEGDGLYSDNSYDEEAEESSTEGETAEEVSEEDASSNKKTRKLITNISMSVETREFDELISFLKKRTNEIDGYIENESINNNSYGTQNERYGHIIFRIPEDKLDSFISDVSGKSNILSQDRSVKDVTLQYADLESHKKALQAEQEQLLALMEKAETIEEILQIQNQLTDVRYQLESMESQLRTYDNQVSYSTVDMSINEVIEYTPDEEPTFGQRAKEGFMDNLAAVISFFVELALAIITHIPMLILVAVLGVVILVIVKIVDKRSKKNKLKRMKNAQMYPQGNPMGQMPGNGSVQNMAQTGQPTQNNVQNVQEQNTNQLNQNVDSNQSEKK